MKQTIDIYKVETFSEHLARLVLEMPDTHEKLDVLKEISGRVSEWCERWGFERKNIIWFMGQDDE